MKEQQLPGAAAVAVAGPYPGCKRPTLVSPILDQALRIAWVVTGVEKSVALARWRRGDLAIPAGRVRSDRALVLRDAAARRTLPGA